MRGIIVASGLAALFASAACSREQPAWASAQRDDTEAAYAGYMQDFPAGAHAAEARAAIRALRDDAAWARAERIGTPEAWQRYLADWPEGSHRVLAQQMLVGFIPPEPSRGDYEIQLGAWRDEPTARQELAAWQGERAAVLEGEAARLVAPFGDGQRSTAGPALWRLRAGPLAEDEARALCANIKAAGADCVPAAAISAGDPPP